MLTCGRFKFSKQNELMGKAVNQTPTPQQINKNTVASSPVKRKCLFFLKVFLKESLPEYLTVISKMSRTEKKPKKTLKLTLIHYQIPLLAFATGLTCKLL